MAVLIFLDDTQMVGSSSFIIPLCFIFKILFFTKLHG